MSVSSVLSPSSIVVPPKATTSQPATAAKKLRFGVVLALISNVLFGVLYLYSHWLAPLSGTQVFLWRMVARWFGGVIGCDAKFWATQSIFDGIKQTTMGFIAVADTDFGKPAVAIYVGAYQWTGGQYRNGVFFVSLDDGTDGLCGV